MTSRFRRRTTTWVDDVRGGLSAIILQALIVLVLALVGLVLAFVALAVM